MSRSDMLVPDDSESRHEMVGMGNSSFKRFVAGPSIIERNPLSEPLSTVGSANYARFPAYAASTVNSIQE